MLLLRTAFETVLVTCVSVAIAALVAARWSTLFPAIAVDRFLSFRQAWRMSQGNGLRLWAIIFLVTMPVYLIFVPIIGGVGFENYLAITILKSVLFIVITATGTSALSAAYRPAFEGDSPAIAVFD